MASEHEYSHIRNENILKWPGVLNPYSRHQTFRMALKSHKEHKGKQKILLTWTWLFSSSLFETYLTCQWICSGPQIFNVCDESFSIPSSELSSIVMALYFSTEQIGEAEVNAANRPNFHRSGSLKGWNTTRVVQLKAYDAKSLHRNWWFSKARFYYFATLSPLQ